MTQRRRNEPRELQRLISSTQHGKSTTFGEVSDIPRILVGGYFGYGRLHDPNIGKSEIFLRNIR